PVAACNAKPVERNSLPLLAFESPLGIELPVEQNEWQAVTPAKALAVGTQIAPHKLFSQGPVQLVAGTREIRHALGEGSGTRVEASAPSIDKGKKHFAIRFLMHQDIASGEIAEVHPHFVEAQHEPAQQVKKTSSGDTPILKGTTAVGHEKVFHRRHITGVLTDVPVVEGIHATGAG